VDDVTFPDLLRERLQRHRDQTPLIQLVALARVQSVPLFGILIPLCGI
jgi:hypothetical protein